MGKAIGQFDVIIVGGGLVGMTMACAIASAGIKIAIIEAQDPKKTNDDKFDGRCSAIAPNSANMFHAIGVWNELQKNAGPIKEIYVTDKNSPFFLHFGEEDHGTDDMGYMIENRFIRKALFANLKKQKNITLFAPDKYKDIKFNKKNVAITLDSGKKIEAKLLIAADGRNSKIREMAGIEIVETDYNQSGIVCAVKHEKDHKCVAQERFFPAGPFAILPMKDRHHSSLVWSDKRELADHYMEMDKQSFEQEVQERFGDYLGKVELVGMKWCYPLSLTFAKKYSAGRVCLLGDAAHAIHPIAGTGMNLSLRDVAQLAELIVETKNCGLDIGGRTVLDSYQAMRKKDNLLMIAATHGLTRLFSNNSASLRIVRDTGLAIVNKIPFLKKQFVNYAKGKGRNLPRLAKGEKL